MLTNISTLVNDINQPLYYLTTGIYVLKSVTVCVCCKQGFAEQTLNMIAAEFSLY